VNRLGHCALVPVALASWCLGCGEARSPPEAPAPLDSLITLADSLHRTGEYAPARAAWLAGLARLRPGQDSAAEVRMLTSLGLTEWRLGDYPAARGRVEQARALGESNGRPAPPRTYNALGLIAWDQGNLSEAADLWRRTMAIADSLGDQEYVAKPAMNLGLYYSAVGEFDDATRTFRAGHVAGRLLGLPSLELRSLVNLAMVANRKGEPREALAWLDSAVAGGLERDFLAEDMYRSQIAVAAWTLGDPGVALAGLDSAIRKARAAGLRQSEAANLSLMADIYWEAGDPVRALDLHNQAAGIHKELGLPAEEGGNLLSAARIQAGLGRPGPAAALVSQALALHRQAEDLVLQLSDHLLLAELAGSDHLAEARRIAMELDTRAARTRLGLAEARLAERAGRPREVLRSLERIAPLLDEGLSAELSEAEALRARALGGLGDWVSAAAAGRRAVAALERTRSGFGSSLLGTSFASFRAGVYGDLVAALLALDRGDEAFEVADLARGGWARAIGPAAERGSLLRRITALEDEIRAMDEDGRESREFAEQLRVAQRQYELQVLGPDGAGTARRVRANTVRSGLGKDEALLAYLVAGERLFVFTATREGNQAEIVQVGGAELEARVRLARAILADPAVAPGDAEPVLRALSRWLLPPAARLAGVRRLVVVPHGVLAYLPFGALLTPDDRYLIERYDLVHLPSAAFLELSGSRKTGPEIRVTALAPFPDELPATRLEVGAIGQTHPGSRVLIGRRARETALRTALGSDAVTHVASHGVLNAVNPLFSRIELARGPGRSPEDDGRLEVHEALRLAIQSPLVFLSGCETGLGPGGSRRYSPGEDYATLAAAFLSAGARQVVSTLWAISDTSAAVFAARFYAEVKRRPPSQALTAAQRALLADQRFRHPYYWAGYRLAGSDARPPSAAVTYTVPGNPSPVQQKPGG